MFSRFKPVGPGRAYALVTAIAERLLLDDRAALDRIGDAARNVLGLLTPLAAPSRPLPGPLGRHQVLGAIRRLLVASAGGDELLLQVDDVHLAGDADVDVLMQLAMGGAPVCLLLGLRPTASDSVLARGIARLHAAGALQLLELGPLDDDECRRLVQRAASAPLDAEFAARVVGGGTGQPLRGHRAGALCGRVARRAAAAQYRAGRAGAPVRRARAGAGVAEMAGAVRRHFRPRAPSRPWPTRPRPRRCSVLDVALSEGVLRARWQPLPPFAIDLVRQALADQVPSHRRTQMHRRIAELLAEQARGAGRHRRPLARRRQAARGRALAGSRPARDAVRLAAFSDALRHLDAAARGRARSTTRRCACAPRRSTRWAIRPRWRPTGALPKWPASPPSHDLLAKAALAQVKQGDPKGALVLLDGLQPSSVEGRLCEALAYSGAAALGATDPAIGTAKAAVARRLALQTGDTASIVVASWAQAAAAHARGELHQSVWADLQETAAVPHLAVRVFDGHLCITQRFLYGARPYADVIAFADALATEAQAVSAPRAGRPSAPPCAARPSGCRATWRAARQHLREGARMHCAIGGAVGQALSLQRLAELALHEGHKVEARALVDEALDLARQTDIGFHLLDRIYGTRIALHGDDPAAALHVMHDAAASVRGPLETCPGCRITFAVPAAIAAARAGELALAEQHEEQCAYLADVVMRLPAWHAAHDEVRGHIAAATRRSRRPGQRRTSRPRRRVFAARASRSTRRAAKGWRRRRRRDKGAEPHRSAPVRQRASSLRTDLNPMC